MEPYNNFVYYRDMKKNESLESFRFLDIFILAFFHLSYLYLIIASLNKESLRKHFEYLSNGLWLTREDSRREKNLIDWFLEINLFHLTRYLIRIWLRSYSPRWLVSSTYLTYIYSILDHDRPSFIVCIVSIYFFWPIVRVFEPIIRRSIYNEKLIDEKKRNNAIR